MRRMQLVILFCLLLCARVQGQEHLVAVLGERTMTFDEQLAGVLDDFGSDISADDYSSIINLFEKLGRATRYVAVEYRTVDPKGNPVVASGIIAYPETGKFRGTLEVSPYTKEKYCCGTKRMYAAECLPTNLGYVTLLPDTIGYGSTEDLPISYLFYQNVARVSADLRLAAKEYFAALGGRQLPDKTIFFGYSLGAPGALETACYYSAHPEYGVKIKNICIGGGAFYPDLALRQTVYNGEITYLIYPGIAVGLDYWMDLHLDYSKLLWGEVLDNLDTVSDGMTNMRDLAKRYGFRVQQYLHPDFFLPEKNEEINRLMDALASLKAPSDGYVLPKNVKIRIIHSAEDLFVPVECADLLYEELKKDHPRVTYLRMGKGTHYEAAAVALVTLFRQLIL